VRNIVERKTMGNILEFRTRNKYIDHARKEHIGMTRE
jgi:hypothetical protein